MTVKRYEAMHRDVWDDESGKFVRYEDYAELQRQLTAYEATVTNLKAQAQGLAAENELVKQRMNQLIQIISNADNNYCMCGDEMKSHAHGGCGHPTGMFDYHYNQWLESSKETPITDAALAEMRAQGVEMFVAALQKHIDEGDFVGDEIAVIAGAIDAGGDFSEQLRKEQGK